MKLSFEKANERISRDILDSVMSRKGFGIIWRKWKGCLNAASFSLVFMVAPRNGSTQQGVLDKEMFYFVW